MTGLFKRINFFKGLFMKEKDWQNEQTYHMEKQRFHNKYLHTPGVVFSCLEGLKVSVSESGTSLWVAPGYAIDGDGKDLFVPEAKELVIPDLQSFNPPATIYVSLKYEERLSDRRENTANPLFTGYAYVSEASVMEISNQKPDNYNEIELARVNLSGDPRIGNPGGEENSEGNGESEAGERQNVLIMDHVPEAGAMNQTRDRGLGLSDFAVKLVDTELVVISRNRKQEDTNVLIEQYPKDVPPPMYMVFLHSLEGTRSRWAVECTENDQGTLDYTVHIRNESNRTITVYLRVYRVRI